GLRVLRLAVVGLVGQAQARLVEVDDVALGVLRVVVDVEGDRARGARALKSAERAHEALAALRGAHELEVGLERHGPRGLDRVGVHEACEQVADLRLDARGGRALRGGLLDDLAHVDLGLVVQATERPVARAVRGDLVGVEPGPVDVPEQVVPRVGPVVEGGRVDAAAGHVCSAFSWRWASRRQDTFPERSRADDGARGPDARVTAPGRWSTMAPCAFTSPPTMPGSSSSRPSSRTSSARATTSSTMGLTPTTPRTTTPRCASRRARRSSPSRAA